MRFDDIVMVAAEQSVGPAFDADALTLFAAMSVQPDITRKALINGLILSLKSGGVWTKLDVFYGLAAHAAQAARLNWKNPAQSATAVNSPTFTTDRGYAGDGSSSYLDTGYIPSAGSGTTNSASLGVWANAGDDTAADVRLAGCADASQATHIAPRFTGDVMRGRVNSGTTSSSTASSTTRLGSSTVSRTSATGISFYRNGVVVGAEVAVAPVGRPTTAMYICGFNSNGAFGTAGNNRIALAWAGQGLSAGEISAAYAACNTFLSSIGAA